MSVIKTSGESFLKEKKTIVENINNLKEKSTQQEITWLYEDLQRKAHYLLTQEENDEISLSINNTTTEYTIDDLENLVKRLEKVALIKKEKLELIKRNIYQV